MKFIGLLLIFLLLHPSIVFSLTLTEAIQSVWQNSNQIHSQQNQLSLAHGDRWRRFLPNSPQAQYGRTDDGSAETFGVSETFAFPGKSIAYLQLDSEKEKVQRAELYARKFELAKVITDAFVDCASARANSTLQARSLQDTETLARTFKTRYEAGSATQAENVGMELQLRQQRADLQLAHNKEQVSCQKLGTLLPLSEKQLGSLVMSEDLTSAIVDQMNGKSPDENRAEAALSLARVNRKLNWWGQLPDITISATKNHYLYLPASPSGKEWTMSYGVAMTIPLFIPLRESVEADRTAQQSLADQATAELQLVNARSDRAEAGLEYQRSRARLKELSERDLVLADALVESTLSAYRTGRLGFAEIVLARKTVADLRAQEVQLQGSILTSHLKCLDQCGVASNSTLGGAP